MNIAVKYIDTTVYHVQTWHDSDPENPREWDNLGTMICWHSRYTLGDKHNYNDPEEFNQEYTIKAGKPNSVFMLPLYLYDHSGLTMSTKSFGDSWDSGQVGYIYVTVERAKEEFPNIKDFKQLKSQVYKNLEAEARTYSEYLSGVVYGVAITAPGEEEIACWGIYGLEGVREYIREEIGEAKYETSGVLADYL